MKIAPVALAFALALSSTLASAQTGGGLSNPGLSTGGTGSGNTTGNTSLSNETTTGSAAGNLNAATPSNPPREPAIPDDSAGNPPLSPSPSAPGSPTHK